MRRILILGCGEMAWGRPSASALFGRQWSRGRLSERIGLGPGGPLPGEAVGQDWGTLAEELDRRTAWRPAAALGPIPSPTFLRGEPAKPPLLPAWPELAASQAQWATRELGGAGVLVTPKDWLASLAGRELLAAWEAAGWSWTSLEQVLRRRYSDSARCVSASGLWMRVMQREGGLVLANGPEAARALETAPAVLDLALAQLDSELANRWRLEEEPASGWYVHQQLARRIAKALKNGRTMVDLTSSSPFQISKDGRMIADPGGANGALFRFSCAAAQDRYRALSALRISVELPAVTLSWWEQVSQAGFLRSPEGGAHPGIGWGDRKTVLFEGAEVHQLTSFMASRGIEHEEVDPARLEEALELGAPLPPPIENKVRKAPSLAAKAPVPAVAMADSAPLRVVAPKPAQEASVEPLRGEVTAPAPSTTERVELHAAPQAAREPSLTEEDLPLAATADATGKRTETTPVDQVTAFTTFQPQVFSLADVPHRVDRVRVWLDGSRVEPENVYRSARQGVYTIEGIPVPHGAIVRIDFEPPQD